MDKKKNKAINICIAGLVICSVGGIAEAAWNVPYAFRVSLSIVVFFTIVFFWSYKPEGKTSRWIRRSIWIYILILILVGLIGILNVFTEWTDPKGFLRFYTIFGYFLGLMEVVYLVVLKKELADKAC